MSHSPVIGGNLLLGTSDEGLDLLRRASQLVPLELGHTLTEDQKIIPFGSLRFACPSWNVAPACVWVDGTGAGRANAAIWRRSTTTSSRARDPFAVNVHVRALDAIHVATAELLRAEAEGEPLEFWTHDDRQATAALSRGVRVRWKVFTAVHLAAPTIGLSGRHWLS